MRYEVRQILNQVEEVLLQNNDTSRDLWTILTSLRGPDNEDTHAKYYATIPVRRGAFPRIAAKIDAGGIKFGSVNGAVFHKDLIVSVPVDVPRDHFHVHHENAMNAINYEPIKIKPGVFYNSPANGRWIGLADGRIYGVVSKDSIQPDQIPNLKEEEPE